MEHIVVGTDGSPAAAVAVRWAAGAAKALDAELVVATVAPPDASTSELDELRRQLEGAWSSPARDAGPSLRTLLVQGDPRAALARASVDAGADLTVLGSSGTGWFPAIHLGSVAHHVAQHAAGPVAIIPREAGSFSASQVTLGVDGSPGALAAVTWCAELARLLHSDVAAVYAHQSAARAGAVLDTGTWREEAEQRSAQWTAPLAESGCGNGACVVAADPAQAIVQSATTQRADMIVIGTRGAGGFHGLRLGSVALKLLHHAERPTVLVPPTAS